MDVFAGVLGLWLVDFVDVGRLSDFMRGPPLSSGCARRRLFNGTEVEGPSRTRLINIVM